MNDALTKLLDLLTAHAAKSELAWLTEQRVIAAAADTPAEALAIPYALARRRFGTMALPAATPEIDSGCGALPLAGWPLGDLARVVLLLGVCTDRPDIATATIEAVYRGGDDGEQTALIRALALLDRGDALQPLALDATRTNSVTLFAALAQRNPYPAARFDDHDFDHLVLKALFIGVALTPVVGLRRRCNAEMARMCEDYIDERLAAGRSVPPDIWLALAPHAGSRGLARLEHYLGDADPAHRLHAAVACGWREPLDEELRTALAGRVEHETEPQITAALHASLQEPLIKS